MPIKISENINLWILNKKEFPKTSKNKKVIKNLIYYQPIMIEKYIAILYFFIDDLPP